MEMNLIIDNVSSLLEIDRVNDFVVAIIFIAVFVLCLSTVTLEGLAMNLMQTTNLSLPE